MRPPHRRRHRNRGGAPTRHYYRRRTRHATDDRNADGENNEVRILKREDGTVLGAFGRSGRNAGQFHWVHNLAVDSKGDVFTTEVDNAKRVQKFHPVISPPLPCRRRPV
jgi:hypothetical protein